MGTEKVNNKNKNKKQGKYLSKKNIILLSVALLLLIIIILLSPMFAIKKIEISQVSLYPQEEIEAYFNTFKGENGFVSVFSNTTFSQIDGLFKGRITEKEKEFLFDYPLIKKVSINYDFPNKMIVDIEERVPMMMTEADGLYLYVDSEGVLLGAYTQKDILDMPLIKGIEIPSYKVGSSIVSGNDKNITSAIAICSIMKQLSMLSYVDIIDVTDYNNIRMHCTPKLTIEFGNTDDVGRKLSYIKGIIDKGYDGESDGILDVSSSGNPIFKENSDVIEKEDYTDTDIENEIDGEDTTDGGLMPDEDESEVTDDEIYAENESDTDDTSNEDNQNTEDYD